MINPIYHRDLFNYKARFTTAVLVLGYTFLHFNLTGQYVESTLEQFLDLSARLPYGQRILVPAIAHGLSLYLPFSGNHLFFILELIINSFSFFFLFKLFCQEYPNDQATALSWLFFLLLPLMTVVNYGFVIHRQANFYYPYDSASLFFITAGLYFCQRSQWRYFIPLVFIATFNKESSLLLVLMVPALHWHKLSSVIRPMLLALITYALARIIVLKLVCNLPGKLVEFYLYKQTHFLANFIWLFDYEHVFLFLFCFGGLPLFWFVFYDYIPLQYRPLRYVMLFYFVGLLLFGNFWESRLYLEISVMMYFPSCLAIRRWLLQLKPYYSNRVGVLYYVNRYFVIATLLLIACMRNILNPIVIYLANHV